MDEKIVVASDVAGRDGIGIEVYLADILVLEIFRDDAKKTRTITSYKHEIPLDDMERYISFFKKEIPADFVD